MHTQDELGQRTYAEQIALLYSTAPIGYAIALIGGAILAIVQAAEVPLSTVTIWYGGLVIATTIRGLIWFSYQRATDPRAKAHVWERWFLIGALLAGISWGSATVVFFPHGDVNYDLFVIFVLAGMTAGAVAVYSARFSAYVCFALPIFIAVAVRFFVGEAKQFDPYMGLFTLLFSGGMLLTARNMSQMVRTSLILRFDNQELSSEIAERRQVEQILEHRLALERVVAEISTTFMRLAPGEIDQGIQHALARIGQFANADRSYLFRFADDYTRITNTHTWCAQEAQTQVAYLQHLPSEAIPKWIAQLHQGEMIYISDTSQLPEEDQVEKEVLQEQGIQSLLVFPVSVGGVLSAALGLDTVRSATLWSEEDQVLLRLTSELVGNALDRQQNTQRLEDLATHDSLTHLPNRRLLEYQLAHALSQAKRRQQWVGVLYMDLDNFKYINDSLGHDAGDQVLQLVASRLVNSIRASDMASRLGGDEFVLVLEDIRDKEGILRVVEKVISNLSVPLQVRSSEVLITLSVGISLYPEDGVDGSQLLRCADRAMYHAKSSGKNQYRFYADL